MKKKTILLVEDNPDDIILTKRSLKKSNILNKLIVTNDGVEALEYLFCEGKYAGRDKNDMPQVILLDIKMPKMDGLETLKHIRADVRTKLLPVIVLTSSKEESDIFKSYRLGANSYVCKPVDFEQFHKAITELGLYWLILNQNPPKINNKLDDIV